MMIIIDQKIKLDDLLHFYESCYRFLDISYFSRKEIIKARQREGQQVLWKIFYILHVMFVYICKIQDLQNAHI